MSAKWREEFLIDLYEIRSGLSKPAKDFGTGYPFLAFKDVFNNFFVPESLSQLVQSSEKERKSCSVRRGDVFLTRTSETMHELGMSCVALKDYEHATFNGFTKRLRPKAGIDILPEYIGYYLRSPRFRSEMVAFSTMSTRASLNNEMIGRLRMVIPPISEQKFIARVLKSLDDKIELNRQINQTLEQITQAIFKSWFVDFEPVKAKIEAKQNGQDPERAAMHAISGKTEEELNQLPQNQLAQLQATAALFPDELVDSELDLIPKGWEVSSIGKEVAIVGGGTPSTKNPDFWEHGSYNWTTPKDLSGNQDKILLSTGRKITEAGLEKISSGLLPIDTVLLSSRAPVGYLALAKVPVAVNQGYIAMKCDKDLPPVYVLQWANSVMDDIKQRASGTTFAEISKKNFRIIPVLVPNEEVLNIYSRMVDELYDNITKSISESATLAQLRDILLPKLLSGEIDLSGNAPSE